jgi:hypothetical protein
MNVQTKIAKPRSAPAKPGTALAKPKSAADRFVKLKTKDTADVLTLPKHSTSIEMKVTIPFDNRDILRKIGFDPVEAEARQIYFFDTPDLQLNQAGLIVRARRRAGGRGDTVVKMRPVHPPMVDPKLFGAKLFKVEVDVLHGGYVCSASAKGKCTAKDVYDVTEAKKPLKSIFTREQQEYFQGNAPPFLKMSQLVALGPVFMLCMKCQPDDFDREMTVELWLYTDGTRTLELSTKGTPDEAFELGMKFRDFLGKAKLMREAEAATKTSTALKLLTQEGDGSGRPIIV